MDDPEDEMCSLITPVVGWRSRTAASIGHSLPFRHGLEDPVDGRRNTDCIKVALTLTSALLYHVHRIAHPQRSMAMFGRIGAALRQSAARSLTEEKAALPALFLCSRGVATGKRLYVGGGGRL